MPAYDIAARVGSWITEVIDARTILTGEEAGWSVTPRACPSPEGDVITWTLILTMRHPLPGRGDLAATATVQAVVPSEDGVRHFAESSLAKLRAQAGQAKRGAVAVRNGHAKRAPDA